MVGHSCCFEDHSINLIGEIRMGMAGSGQEPRILGLRVTDTKMTACLVDGRTVSVPLAWSWRLSEATPEQRRHFEIIGDGVGVHWPDIDEDISASGMLSGAPAPRPKHTARL
jgi:hypothetical protein